MELTSAAVYRRIVGASLERIWENVLDWEHLPWLHRSTFSHIRLLEQRRDGWLAETALRDSPRGDDFVIDVRIDRAALLYHSRTADGPGTGTDIVTRLEPLGPHITRIAVEFLVPDVSQKDAARLARAYTRSYTRLWDEDEAMMQRRQEVRDHAGRRRGRLPEPIDLGPEPLLRARLPLTVEADGQSYRVVELDGTLLAHGTVCPHWGGPLAEAAVADGCLTCPWHGYRFDVRTGRSADGHRLRLAAAPRIVRDRGGRCTLVEHTAEL